MPNVLSVSTGVLNQLTVFHNEVKAELDEILSYWMDHTQDLQNGGFFGKIDEHNLPHPEAAKGSVLHSRILWSFSSAYAVTANADNLAMADRAYNYIIDHFLDTTEAGVYWTVNAKGEPLDTKKQIYALAFALYGCCAYYQVTNNEHVKGTAIGLFNAIEKYSFDKNNGGYFEAFTRDWTLLDDLRLSAKDANERKTMNTHLHVLEAYTSLFSIWPDKHLKNQLLLLLDVFTGHIINAKTSHLDLFFDDTWQVKTDIISYGHDIEAAWLLMEAAHATGDHALIKDIEKAAMKIAVAAAEGLDVDGGLQYEKENGHLVKEKHWWVQAEAMVGFFNHWQLTNNNGYLQKSLAVWQYIKTSIKDDQFGEWFWGRLEDGSVMPNEDKAGLWKCPYHNSRACLEIMRRTGDFIKITGEVLQ